jgi:hypothetical protein
MFCRELVVAETYGNNFYDGALDDLVFFDLEWCRDFTPQGLVNNKLFGYTMTRILPPGDRQYIRIQLIEQREQERDLIATIVEDLYQFQDKYFVGYGISTSDIACLRQRLEAMHLIPRVTQMQMFDLQRSGRHPELRQGLNRLFAHLQIPIHKAIEGRYIYTHGMRVLRRQEGYEAVLQAIYEYCLEDARNYFHIVAKWGDFFPRLQRRDRLCLPIVV